MNKPKDLAHAIVALRRSNIFVEMSPIDWHANGGFFVKIGHRGLAHDSAPFAWNQVHNIFDWLHQRAIEMFPLSHYAQDCAGKLGNWAERSLAD